MTYDNLPQRGRNNDNDYVVESERRCDTVHATEYKKNTTGRSNRNQFRQSLRINNQKIRIEESDQDVDITVDVNNDSDVGIDVGEHQTNAPVFNNDYDSVSIDKEENAIESVTKIKSAYNIYQKLNDELDFKVFKNQLYVFNKHNQTWSLIDDSMNYRALRKIIPDPFKPFINSNVLKELFEWLISESEEVCETQLKSHRYYLNFRDCAIDWRNLDVIDRKKLFFRYELQVDYPKKTIYGNKKDSRFVDFIERQYSDDPDTKREFYKFIGITLSEIRDLKYAFFLYGPSNTGKSVFMNLMKNIVGRQYTSNVSFAQMSDEFAVSKLLGKRLNISGEVSGTTNKRKDIFKSLTGNDEVEVRAMYKDFFTLKNECLLVFGCNELPSFEHNENFDSIMNRIIIFPFFKQVDRSFEWIENYELYLLKDIHSIISVAVKGLQYLEEDGFVIKESKAMKMYKEEYILTYNSFIAFCRKHIVANSESKVCSEEITKAYEGYCKKHAITSFYSNQWVKLLMQQYPIKKVTMGEPRKRGYKGIKLIGCDKYLEADN